MTSLQHLIDRNRLWAAAVKRDDPEFFVRLARQQTPQYLWIGCSDSRVPATEICGLVPGEMFVHRNVANVVVHTDLNCLTAMQFAVDVLRVQHIIVCGHYGCGGVAAATSHQDFGLINRWLQNIKDCAERNQAELGALPDEESRTRRLVELNVVEQVDHLAKTSVIQRAWQDEGRPWLHGWVFDMETGRLKELVLRTSADLPHEVHRFDLHRP